MKVYKILNSIRRVYWFVFRPKTTGVKCLVKNHNNEFLLIKNNYAGDYWTVPGGGRKKTETIEQAAMR